MLVGWGRTREMLLLGETFDAASALDWGLVERVVARVRVGRMRSMAGLPSVISAQPHAVRLQKRLIRAWEDLPVRAAVAAGVDAFEAAYETPEPVTAMRAFLGARANGGRLLRNQRTAALLQRRIRLAAGDRLLHRRHVP